ncbi:hypothetical protein [Devosia sp. A449]
MPATYLTIIADLMIELSTEIDLHYEDSDLPALTQTMGKLRAAAAFLASNGSDVPDAFVHLNARVLRGTN